MNKQLLSSNKLTRLRCEQRLKELEQLKQSLRFGYNCKELAKDVIDNQVQHQQLTKEKLFAVLREGDIESLYTIISEANFADEDLFEELSVQIYDFLQQRLSSPLGVLTLANLINNFECWTYLAYNRKGITELVECMSRLYPGSQGQKVYLWALCTATERSQAVQIQQLNQLLPLLQKILKVLIQTSKDDHFFIQLLKNLSELSLPFSDELLIYLCNYFWKVDNKGIIINIYLLCTNLIKRKVFNKSTKVLIQLLVVCLRGRAQVSSHLLTYSPHLLLQPHVLLRDALIGYNEVWESMQTETTIEMEGITIKTCLHSFLLAYQTQIFSKFQSPSNFLQFLLLFCINGSIKQTLGKFLELGTFDHIVNLLTSNAQNCLQCLKILKILTYRAIHEQERNGCILQVISCIRFDQAIMEALLLFPSNQLSTLGCCVLSMLQGKQSCND